MTLYMYICFKRCPRIRISMFLGARSINDAAVGAMACNRPDLGLHPQFQRAPRVRPGHYGVRGAGKLKGAARSLPLPVYYTPRCRT